MLKLGQVPLSETHPFLTAEWHPTKNTCDITMVHAKSAKKCWWVCETCEHEWPAVVRHRVERGVGCPKCNSEKVSETNNLQYRYPAVAAQWHPTKNGDLTPANVAPHSKKIVWWVCSKRGHEWPAMILNRTKHGKGCSECRYEKLSSQFKNQPQAPRRKKLIDEFPDIAKEFHRTKNGTRKVEDFTSGSSKIPVWWICSTCKHEWPSNVTTRTINKCGCPRCNKSGVNPENNLVSRFPDIAAEWDHDLNNESPDTVAPTSHAKRNWICKTCRHKWPAKINARTTQHQGCPECAKKVRLATRLSSKQQMLKQHPNWVTTEDVATELGISVSYVKKKVNKLPGFPQPVDKIGRGWVFDKDEVMAYVERLTK